MNWVFIIQLIEALSEIFGNCPEKRSEARRERAYIAVRNQTRRGRRFLLRGIRTTPRVAANGEVLFLDNGEPDLPRGREVLKLFREVQKEIAEMTDNELREHIDQVDEIYEEKLKDAIND